MLETGAEGVVDLLRVYCNHLRAFTAPCRLLVKALGSARTYKLHDTVFSEPVSHRDMFPGRDLRAFAQELSKFPLLSS